MSFTLNGVTYYPQTATQHAQNMLADMNAQLSGAGLPTLTATQANALWWTLLAQGTVNATQDLALEQASNSMNIALCDDDQIMSLLPTMGTALIPASPSSVTLTITATSSGATVPSGSLAVSGPYKFSTIQTIVIPASGSLTVGAVCTVNGPITAGAGTITSFSPPVTGVASVTNASVAIVGRNIETVSQARTRLIAGGALSSGVQGAITALQALPGITQAVVLFNPSTSTNLPLNGYAGACTPRSAMIFVIGDNPGSIASTYFQYMNAPSPQANYAASGASALPSTYTTSAGQALTIYYEKAVALTMFVQVTYLINTTSTTSAVTSAIQAVITGLNGTFQIGQKVTTTSLYKAFQSFSQAQVLSISISADGGSNYYQSVAIPANTYPVFGNATNSNIVVTGTS